MGCIIKTNIKLGMAKLRTTGHIVCGRIGMLVARPSALGVGPQQLENPLDITAQFQRQPRCVDFVLKPPRCPCSLAMREYLMIGGGPLLPRPKTLPYEMRDLSNAVAPYGRGALFASQTVGSARPNHDSTYKRQPRIRAIPNPRCTISAEVSVIVEHLCKVATKLACGPFWLSN